MSSELLPCPFCGGELKIDWSMGSQYWAYCPNDKCCFYETLIYDSVSELVEACNTRAQTVFGMTLDEVRQMMKRDAERERTCTIEKRKHGYVEVPECSECGAWWLDPEKDSYCHNCGAKVVGE